LSAWGEVGSRVVTMGDDAIAVRDDIRHDVVRKLRACGRAGAGLWCGTMRVAAVDDGGRVGGVGRGCVARALKGVRAVSVGANKVMFERAGHRGEGVVLWPVNSSNWCPCGWDEWSELSVGVIRVLRINVWEQGNAMRADFE
jgi:hypothetical protein